VTYEYPLAWPPGFRRTKHPVQSRFDTAGKAMQRKTHPDAGGSDEDFQEVQEAIREAVQGD
jgi:hypothetical protein